MSFVESIQTVLTKYCDFTGRARRSEYWWFALANTVLSMILSVLGRNVSTVFTIISVIVSLALLLPSLGVAIRRLHDTGRSGWWFLLVFTCVGAIVLIVFYCLDSEPGDNQYGPNPKGM
jgi:uncharacterized membrane protein YhaH (DUF805 family)